MCRPATAGCAIQSQTGSKMPLTPVAQPGTLDNDHEGVLFAMLDGGRTISILVSLHALEDIDPPEHGEGHIERFNEFRTQFEQIASDKYDKGLIEQDGTVCIRGRDLPGKGH
jgi:Protein of unknown function (DUF1488)